MNSISRYFLKHDILQSIAADDVVGKNRFVLFRIFTLSGSLVCIGAALKMVITIPDAGLLPWGIVLMACVMLLNYAAVLSEKKLQRAYLIVLLSAFVLLHMVAYTCGGIRTGGILFYGVIILYAYMLLGKKGGQWFSLLFAVNVLYFFIVSTYTDWTSFSMFKNDVGLINQDFLINALLTFYLIGSQGSYLQSGKNIIVQTLEKSRRELESKAIQLEENNMLLEEYTKGLEKSNRELDKFASVASHDLKAPIRAIGTLSDFIDADMGHLMNDESKNNLQIIKSRAKRMDLLLDALLKYSRADRKELLLTEVNTNLLIEKIIQECSVKRNCSFKIKNLFPVIEANMDALHKVFEILIDNAIRFNDKAIAEIELRSEDHDLDWKFYVKDNGPGIEKFFHEKIFIIFQTVNSRDAFESTGAGLAIAKKIIESKGGNIGVNSVRGEGAEFYFSIPKRIKKQNSLLKFAESTK